MQISVSKTFTRLELLGLMGSTALLLSLTDLQVATASELTRRTSSSCTRASAAPEVVWMVSQCLLAGYNHAALGQVVHMGLLS